MTAIKDTMGQGFGNGEVVDVLKAQVDDLTELRTQLIALLAKLDADAGITDTDYESSLTPAALTTTY